LLVAASWYETLKNATVSRRPQDLLKCEPHDH
jgi:hypothetical protein